MEARLRRLYPDCLVYVIAPADAEALRADDAAQVSYLADGAWGRAEVPFRPYREGIEPLPLDTQNEQPGAGRQIRIRVLDPDGRLLTLPDIPIHMKPRDQAAWLPRVDIGKARKHLLLPTGTYDWASNAAYARTCLPADPVVVEPGGAEESIQEIELRLTKHLACVQFRLAARPTSVLQPSEDPLLVDRGSVWVRNEAGATEMLRRTGGLSKQLVWVGEGQNEVQVRDGRNQPRTMFIRVDNSGRYVVDDTGRLTLFR